VFARQPGAAAIAAHYQVPRHTANGWLRRLRDQGVIPPIR
jgi:transposase